MGAPKLKLIKGGDHPAEQTAEVPHLQSASQIPLPQEQAQESETVRERISAWWQSVKTSWAESGKRSEPFWNAMTMERIQIDEIMAGRNPTFARGKAIYNTYGGGHEKKKHKN